MGITITPMTLFYLPGNPGRRRSEIDANVEPGKDLRVEILFDQFGNLGEHIGIV